MSCGVSDSEKENQCDSISPSLILHLRLNPSASGDNTPGGRQKPVTTTPRQKLLQKEFCSRITPSWTVDEEGLFLDLRGLERMYGAWAHGAVAVCQLAQLEFPVWSAGLASSQLSSRLASLTAARGDRGQLFAVPHGSVSAFLAGFSVQVLERNFREISRLLSLGVHTLGDLQTLPESLLVAVFGSVGGGLVKEAWGRTLEPLSTESSTVDQVLVAQVHFTRPLVSTVGERALRRALAMRILTRELGRGRWFLSVHWSSGAHATQSFPGPAEESWTTWLGLVDRLWARLPSHRQGIRKVELRFQSQPGEQSAQMVLFRDPNGSPELSRAITRIRRKIDPGFTSASEALLKDWGACWGKAPEKS